MMVLTGRLTYMTIWEIIGTVSMKRQGARERGVFSAVLESHRIKKGLLDLQNRSQSYVIMSCVVASFQRAECGNQAKAVWVIGLFWNG